MAYQVLIPQMVADEGIDYLESHGYLVKMGRGASEADLIADVADCDAILLRTAPCTRAVLEAGKNLKIVARHGAGYDNIDLDAANELGIWATNAPLATSESVAEFTLGAIISAAKRIPLCSAGMRRGDFFYKNNHKGIDLENKYLGIVGFGRIGRMVAKKAHFGLDMKILAYDPFAKPETLPDYVELVDWDTVFQKSDVVTLHIPGGKNNKGIVSTKEFAMMKKNALFISAARGDVVDEAALIAALQNGEIMGASVDVYEKEPPEMNNPLFSLDNVQLTPHMASNTEECMAKMALHAAMQIHKVLSGEKPDWPVNQPQL